MNFKRALFTYGVADVLSQAIGLIASPITTRLLTMAQFGAGPLLSVVWSPFSLFQYGGMDSAYPFFYARKKTEEDGLRLIANASFIAYLSVLLVWLSFLVFALATGWLARYAGVTQGELTFYLLGLLPAGLVYWLCYLLRFLERPDSYVKITLLGRILPAVVVLPLLPWIEQDQRLLFTFGAGWILSFLALLFALYEIRRVGHWPFSFTFLNLKISRDMLRYGIVLIPAGASYALIVVTDRLLIGYFLGADSVAIYTIAIMTSSIASALLGWVFLALDPIFFRLIAGGEQSSYLPKIQLLVSSLAVFFGFLSCFSAIWAAPVINLLYPGEYAFAGQLVPLMTFSVVLQALSRVGFSTVLIAQKPKFHAGVYCSALILNIIIGWILIPILGLMGAIFSTLLAEMAILLAWIFLGHVYLKNLPISWKMPLIIVLCTISFVAVLILFPDANNFWWSRFALTFGILLVYAFLLRLTIGNKGISTLYRYIGF